MNWGRLNLCGGHKNSADGIVVLATPHAMHKLSRRRSLHLSSGRVVVLAAPYAHELFRRCPRLTLRPLDDPLSLEWPDPRILEHNEPPTPMSAVDRLASRAQLVSWQAQRS
jgi:hypothetical protein